jgi:hypothetical protein
MGFFRNQEERLAMRLIAWQRERQGLAVPPEAELKRQAGQVVTEAHRIARERGGNVWGIIKEMAADVRDDLKNR